MKKNLTTRQHRGHKRHAHGSATLLDSDSDDDKMTIKNGNAMVEEK